MALSGQLYFFNKGCHRFDQGVPSDAFLINLTFYSLVLVSYVCMLTFLILKIRRLNSELKYCYGLYLRFMYTFGCS